MFNGKRLKTLGIDRVVPFNLQIYLWNIISTTSTTQKSDYLQVFELKDENGMQVVVHRQESVGNGVKAFQHTYYFPDVSWIPITTKVYVMDEYEYSIMLLPHER